MNQEQIQKAASSAKDDRTTKCVEQILELISDNRDMKTQKDEKNELILRLMKEGFEIKGTDGVRKVSAQMLHQAMWRTMNKLKPLDFQLHGTGKPQYMEQMVTYGVTSIMDKAKLIDTFRDKMGVFWNMLMYGDGFYMINANPETNAIAPLIIRPLSNTNVYVDPYATSLRHSGYGREASECCVIFSTSFSQACELMPEIKRRGGPGKIPRELCKNQRETGRSWEQNQELDDETEIGFYFNKVEKKYVVIVGSKCTVVKKLSKDKYPFIQNKEPYIPVGQFMCMPSEEGFYNHGLGELLYRYSILSRKLMNMAAGHVEDSTYPITLVNVPKDNAAKFFNDLEQAHRIRQSGKKGYVAMEYDPLSPGSKQVGAQSLISPAMLNEYQMLYEQISREIRRCGINLDDIEKGNDITATQIIAEEENANAFARQIMEYNASEWKFLLNLSIDMTKKFVSTKNKTEIDMPVSIKIPVEGVGDTQMSMTEITYGDIVSELKSGTYFVKVNARTGAIPSNTMKIAQISRLMSMTPPGTPAYFELLEQFARLNDQDFEVQSFMMPQAPPAAAPAGPEGTPETPIVSETEGLKVGPQGRDNPEPALNM